VYLRVRGDEEALVPHAGVRAVEVDRSDLALDPVDHIDHVIHDTP
jgi:hypothetical protein